MKTLMPLFLCVSIMFFSGCRTDSNLKVDPVMNEKIPENLKKKIAVIQFEDQSIRTKDFNAWERGIPEQIMVSLAAIPHFIIVARGYILKKIIEEQEFQLTGATDQANAVKLGKILNLQYIVRGSFQVFKDTLRINAQVLNVETAEILHQSSVFGKLDNFYELQNSISIKISQGLDVKLNSQSQDKLLRRVDTKSIEASLANYSGEEKLEEIEILKSQKKNEKIKEKAKEAKDLFEKAIRHDKDYERAKQNLKKLAHAIPMTI